MNCERGTITVPRILLNDGRYWARTSDPQLVESAEKSPTPAKSPQNQASKEAKIDLGGHGWSEESDHRSDHDDCLSRALWSGQDSTSASQALPALSAVR